jgi:hypothetical protein
VNLYRHPRQPRQFEECVIALVTSAIFTRRSERARLLKRRFITLMPFRDRGRPCSRDDGARDHALLALVSDNAREPVGPSYWSGPRSREGCANQPLEAVQPLVCATMPYCGVCFK